MRIRKITGQAGSPRKSFLERASLYRQPSHPTAAVSFSCLNFCDSLCKLALDYALIWATAGQSINSGCDSKIISW